MHECMVAVCDENSPLYWLLLNGQDGMLVSYLEHIQHRQVTQSNTVSPHGLAIGQPLEEV